MLYWLLLLLTELICVFLAHYEAATVVLYLLHKRLHMVRAWPRHVWVGHYRLGFCKHLVESFAWCPKSKASFLDLSEVTRHKGVPVCPKATAFHHVVVNLYVQLR